MDVSVWSREEDGPKDEIVGTMLKNAISSMRSGMYEESMTKFNEIIDIGTTDINLLGTIYMYYGRLCRHLKLDAKALEYFEHELNVLKLTFTFSKACDSTRRIVEQAMAMGKFSKAKRCAEDLIDYTSSKLEGESLVKQAHTILASVCLEGYERNLECNPDERKKLLIVCTEQISRIKAANKENPDAESEVEVLMLEAKCFSLDKQLKESQKCYQKCIDLSIKTDQLAKVHRIYYEMAAYADSNHLLFIINHLRSALFYVSKYGKPGEVVKYKLELADKLLIFGHSHEAYLYAMEALESIHKLGLSEKLKDSFLIVSKCLVALGRREQAAYFIILGSVLTIQRNSFNSFYKIIDEVMIAERNDATEGEDVRLKVDASTDPTSPNQFVAKFVVKIEHATSADTWRMVVTDIIEEQKRPVAVEQKENEEPVDFMDLICKMNSRMDDQRTELPASRFLAPRPLSSASKKTNKSHRILPGLRANLAKMQNMKFDTNTVNRLLKRSKKSKSSLHSTSTQGEDTRSDDVTMLSK
uniref:TPR_REGION domain-containing protein n=1 Tax=Caenorhabditis tropicalis TaxID=1561998 RepID=A0A1I7UHH2_9PELO